MEDDGGRDILPRGSVRFSGLGYNGRMGDGMDERSVDGMVRMGGGG